MRPSRRTPLAFAVGFLLALAVAGAPGALSKSSKQGEPHQGTKFQHCSKQVRPFVTEAEVRTCNSRDAIDPQNPANEVIVFDTTAGPSQWIARKLRVKIATLDNQVEFKYLLVGRACGAGSPRITLLVDENGDNKGDLVLDGHVTGFVCVTGEWRYEDLTDAVPRWDVRALPGGVQPPGTFPNVYVPWGTVETAVSTFPNHSVLWGKLVEDSQAFAPSNRGCAYYDVVSIGARTITDWSGTAGRGRAPNNCPGARR